MILGRQIRAVNSASIMENERFLFACFSEYYATFTTIFLHFSQNFGTTAVQQIQKIIQFQKTRHSTQVFSSYSDSFFLFRFDFYEFFSTFFYQQNQIFSFEQIDCELKTNRIEEINIKFNNRFQMNIHTITMHEQ